MMASFTKTGCSEGEKRTTGVCWQKQAQTNIKNTLKYTFKYKNASISWFWDMLACAEQVFYFLFI